MRRLGSGILLLIGWLLAAAPAAHAEKRVALLIGNQGYSSEIGKLANPHNDLMLLEKTLKGLQFEVTLVRDATLGGMHQAVNAYARRVKAAGAGAIAFFYYAGHGAADGGTNYLIPVDVKSAEVGDLWDVSLRLTEITGKLKKEAGNATHFVVFDACRNELKLRAAGSRALVPSRGFEPVAQEIGMLIAYATAEGALASDKGVGSGPYASVLAEELVKPGVEAVTMFRNVQRRVRAAIKQEPYLGFSALGDVYFGGLEGPKPASVAGPVNEEVARLKDQLAKMESELKRQRETGADNAKVAGLAEAQAKKEAEIKRREDDQKKQQIAVASPPAAPAFDAAMATSKIQDGLNRAGCLKATATGTWGPQTRAAAVRFNERSQQPIATDRPTPEAVALLNSALTRICPSECDPRDTFRNGKCVSTSCSQGQTWISISATCKAMSTQERDFIVNVGDVVYFSTGSDDLSPEARQTLSNQARWLAARPQFDIVIEAHSDDETMPFARQMALSMSRGQAVKAHLVGLGADAARIRVVSHANKYPVVTCNDMSCWSQNRRIQTILVAR